MKYQFSYGLLEDIKSDLERNYPSDKEDYEILYGWINEVLYSKDTDMPNKEFDKILNYIKKSNNSSYFKDKDFISDDDGAELDLIPHTFLYHLRIQLNK